MLAKDTAKRKTKGLDLCRDLIGWLDLIRKGIRSLKFGHGLSKTNSNYWKKLNKTQGNSTLILLLLNA